MLLSYSLGMLRLGGRRIFLCVGRAWGPVLHVIAARGGGILRYQSAQRAHIRHQLPDLVRRDFAAKGRHAIGPPFNDGVEDVGRRTTVDPLVVHQRRAYTTPAVGMAARTVQLRKETLAFSNSIGIFVVG